MRILIAPDSFKESLTAEQAAAAIEAGGRAAWPAAEYRQLPLADGGEGSALTLLAACGGRWCPQTVQGPLGEPVTAGFALLGEGRSAAIEMAAASGLALLPPAKRDPRQSSSFGSGQLMRGALDAGARHLILGLGGSATVDGGCGAAQALGVVFRDAAGQVLTGPPPRWLSRLASIDMSLRDPRLAESRLEAACDVDNPLLGPTGAAAVFGPQKGASAAAVEQLEAGLARLAACLDASPGPSLAMRPGAGAGGGMGLGAQALLGAQLRPGLELIAEATGLEAAIQWADLVITGEGRIDEQSARGKTPVGVARLAKKHRRPVIALAGCLGEGYQVVQAEGIDAVFATSYRGLPQTEVLAQAAASLQALAREVIATLALGHTHAALFRHQQRSLL